VVEVGRADARDVLLQPIRRRCGGDPELTSRLQLGEGTLPFLGIIDDRDVRRTPLSDGVAVLEAARDHL